MANPITHEWLDYRVEDSWLSVSRYNAISGEWENINKIHLNLSEKFKKQKVAE